MTSKRKLAYRRPLFEPLAGRILFAADLAAASEPEASPDQAIVAQELTRSPSPTCSNVPSNSLDVDGDGQLAPRDALIIINQLHHAAASKTATCPGADVDGDGQVTADDADIVLDGLNERASSSLSSDPPEGSGPSPASAWTNPQNRFDATGDGIVSPLDVLVVLNEIHQPHHSDGRDVLPENRAANSPPYFTDVDGDQRITYDDAMQIQVALNRFADDDAFWDSLIGESIDPVP